MEPIFAVMALYDAKERKKISESFHLDCNSSELLKMVDDNHSSQERSMASLGRSAIFSVSYPNPDVYLLIKVCSGFPAPPPFHYTLSILPHHPHTFTLSPSPPHRLRRSYSKVTSVMRLTPTSGLKTWMPRPRRR